MEKQNILEIVVITQRPCLGFKIQDAVHHCIGPIKLANLRVSLSTDKQHEARMKSSVRHHAVSSFILHPLPHNSTNKGYYG